MNSRYGQLSADVGIALKGPYTPPYLSGQVTVVGGVILAPEPTGKHLIGAGDPALFDVIDTALVSERELFPLQWPLFANMRMGIGIVGDRSTWGRTQDANSEHYTDYPVTLHGQR